MNAAEYVIMGGLGVAGPEKLAIVCGDERLTYGALTARVSQFAAGFDVPVRGEEARGAARALRAPRDGCRRVAPSSRRLPRHRRAAAEDRPRSGRAPNGIFYLSADRAAVAETGAFLKQRARAELATQSGPMLVINGRVHPRFNRRSASLKARNGVWSAASF
jgi:hypothetical protein